MGTFIDDLLDGAIEFEEESYFTYKDLAEKALLSNIMGFLSSFASSRKHFLDRLIKIKNKEADNSKTAGLTTRMLYIKATEHLEHDGDVDLHSLQNVLLFISKMEKKSCEEFSKILDEMPEGKIKESLKLIMEDKKSLAIKADRLYHDLIETVY